MTSQEGELELLRMELKSAQRALDEVKAQKAAQRDAYEREIASLRELVPAGRVVDEKMYLSSQQTCAELRETQRVLTTANAELTEELRALKARLDEALALNSTAAADTLSPSSAGGSAAECEHLRRALCAAQKRVAVLEMQLADTHGSSAPQAGELAAAKAPDTQCAKALTMLRQMKVRVARLREFAADAQGRLETAYRAQQEAAKVQPADLFPTPLGKTVPEAVYEELQKRAELQAENVSLKAKLAQAEMAAGQGESLRYAYAEAVMRAENAENELLAHGFRLTAGRRVSFMDALPPAALAHAARPQAQPVVQVCAPPPPAASTSPAKQAAQPPLKASASSPLLAAKTASPKLKQEAAPSTPPTAAAAGSSTPKTGSPARAAGHARSASVSTPLQHRQEQQQQQQQQQQHRSPVASRRSTIVTWAAKDHASPTAAPNKPAPAPITLSMAPPPQMAPVVAPPQAAPAPAPEPAPAATAAAPQAPPATVSAPATATSTPVKSSALKVEVAAPKPSSAASSPTRPASNSAPPAPASPVSELVKATDFTVGSGANERQQQELIRAWLSERYGISVPEPTDDPLTFWEAFRDGVVLLDVVDKERPGMVNWFVIARPKPGGRPLQMFQRLSNCTLAAQSLMIVLPSLRSIEGTDISGPNKSVLTMVFQEMIKCFKPR